MEFSQSANMISHTTRPSGISNLPKILPYPKFFDISHLKQMENVLCYVLDHPGKEGFSLLIERDVKNDDVFILAGYWDGKPIELESDTSDLANAAKIFIQTKAVQFVNLMRILKIERAQYYFSVQGGVVILQDFRTAINKFASPGFIRDIFSALVSVSNIRMVEPLSAGNIEAISHNTGSFSGDLIIKPSRFRVYDEDTQENIPFYVEVVR